MELQDEQSTIRGQGAHIVHLHHVARRGEVLLVARSQLRNGHGRLGRRAAEETTSKRNARNSTKLMQTK